VLVKLNVLYIHHRVLNIFVDTWRTHVRSHVKHKRQSAWRRIGIDLLLDNCVSFGLWM